MAKKAVGDPAEALERGKAGYADWVIIALHGPSEYLDHTYRQLMGVLQEMPGIASKLNLSVKELSDFTTVVLANETLEMRSWRVLLRLSAALIETGDIQAIDPAGFDQEAASRRYTKRTNYTFRAVKTTLLVDCASGAVLDPLLDETATRYADWLPGCNQKPGKPLDCDG